MYDNKSFTKKLETLNNLKYFSLTIFGKKC